MTEADYKRLSALASAFKQGARPGRASALEAMLRHVLLIEEELMPANYVSPRSLVTIRDLASGESFSYRLAFPAEADIAKGSISVLSPLGAALLGRKSGDRLEYASPGGPISVSIEEVRNEA